MGKTVEEMKDMPFVGTTKKEFADALKDAIKMLEGKPTVQTTEAVAKKAAVTSAIAVAGEFDADKIVAELGNMSEVISGASKEYDQLVIAIDAKKAELKEVHDIEIGLNTLAALAIAQDKVIADKKEQAQEILDEANGKALEIRQSADEYAENLRTNVREEITITKKEQTRKKEEWEYAFGREKKEAEDSFQDSLNAKAKVLDEREADLEEREEACEEIANTFEGLEGKISELEASIEEKVEEARKDAKQKAEKSNAIASSIKQREHDAEMSIVQAQIVTLKERVVQLEKELAENKDAARASAEQVTEIANNALKVSADRETIAEITKAQAGKRN